MTDKKQPICRECHILFSSWNELAKHIVANQETHPSKSVMFAYHVLSEVDNVRDFKPRMPMSDELKQTILIKSATVSGTVGRNSARPVLSPYFFILSNIGNRFSLVSA